MAELYILTPPRIEPGFEKTLDAALSQAIEESRSQLRTDIADANATIKQQRQTLAESAARAALDAEQGSAAQTPAGTAAEEHKEHEQR